MFNKKFLVIFLSVAILVSNNFVNVYRVIAIDEEVLSNNTMQQSRMEDSDPHAMGLKSPNIKDQDWIEKNMVQIKQVRPNSIGLKRANIERKNKRLPQLKASAAVPFGEEIFTSDSNMATSSDTINLQQNEILGMESLPNQVDNSQLSSFPPIRSQGNLGSCVAFATTYYQLTHETGLKRGWDAINDNSDSKKFSPKFPYNLATDGYESYGISIADAYNIMLTHGCPTWDEFPYVGSNSSSVNYRQWPTDASIWRNALNYKISKVGHIDIDKSTVTPITDNQDTDLNTIKQILNNGSVLVFCTYIRSWQFTTIKDDPSTAADDLNVGKDVCHWMSDKQGGHAMTVVGYDDNIWVDINNDNIVDSGEKGALKIANSWGDLWKDGGFTWVAYDALNKVSAVTGGPSSATREFVMTASSPSVNRLYCITVEDSYTPKLLAEVTLNHPKRSQIGVDIGYSATNGGNPVLNWLPYAPNLAFSEFSFDGTTMPSDATFIFDLSTLYNSIGASDISSKHWYINVSDNKLDSYPAMIKSFRLIDVSRGITIDSTNSFPMQADNSQVFAWINYDINGPVAEQNTWVIMPDMLTARSEFSVASCNGSLYAVGGFNGTTEVNAVEAYDPNTNTWVRKANLPYAKCKSGTVYVDNKIYSVGGKIGNSGDNLGLTEVLMYDANTDQWVKKANMLKGRSGFGILNLNEKIYAIGGFTNFQVLKTMEMYDPTKNTWVNLASMSNARQNFAVGSVQGKIYAIGGYGDKNVANYVSAVEEYDPASNTWNFKENMPITIDTIMGAVTINDKIYINGFCAFGWNGTVQSIIVEYDPILGTWTTVTNVPTSRTGMAIGQIDNKLFAVGGAFRNNSSYTMQSRGTTLMVEAYNLRIDNPIRTDGLLVRKPVIVDSGNNIVTSLGSLKSIKAKVGVTNEGQLQKNTKLIVVLYDTNNAVKAITHTDALVLPGKTDCIEATLAQPTSIQGYKVKVMVWDSMIDMRPLYTTTIFQ